MKYLSLIFFTSFLSWTWNVVHTPQVIPFETHSGLQIELTKLIQNTVLAKKPQATNIQVQKIWSESISPNEIRVSFTYSFDEPGDKGASTHTELHASGHLKKKKESNGGDNSDDVAPEKEIWSLTDVRPQHQLIRFDDESIIRPNENNENNENIENEETKIAPQDHPKLEHSIVDPQPESPSPSKE